MNNMFKNGKNDLSSFFKGFLAFVFISLFTFYDLKAEDLAVGYISSASISQHCTQTVTIKVYVCEYDESDTWANFDVSVNNKTIASVYGNDLNGTWSFNYEDPGASVTRQHDGLQSVNWCTENDGVPVEENSGDADRLAVELIFTPTQEMIESGKLNIKIENLDCNTGNSDNCGALAGSQNVEVEMESPGVPTGVVLTIDDNAKTTITWSDSNDEYFDGVIIERGGIIVATVEKGTETWTDENANENQEEYKIRGYHSVDNGGCYVLGPYTDDVETPEPPVVIKPVGLSATTDRCDGNVLLSWDYYGDVEPTQFEIDADGTVLTANGDERELLHEIGAYGSVKYKIRAIGPINESAWTSTVTGVTSGNPTKPTSFSASRTNPDENKIRLSWEASNYHNKYLIVRNSTSGTTEFEIDEDQESYIDNSVNGCETYTYELYAANRCTDNDGLKGIRADAVPGIRLNPELDEYIVDFDASKAYFPGKIVLEWSVKDGNLSLVDNFKIERTKAGQNAYSVIGTVEGKNSFEDTNALGGVLYEYRITGKLQCENSENSSNSKIAVGFRIPYGIISGNISYESGVNVKGVEVLAEKITSSVGNSLSFSGGYVIVPDNSKLNPSEYLNVEAWIRPESISGEASIVQKTSGSLGYRLYQSDNDVAFGININGIWNEILVRDVLVAGDYIHVAGVKDSEGMKLYVNGVPPHNTYYILTDEDIIYLNQVGIDSDVVAALEASSLMNNVYSDISGFRNNLENVLGEDQAQLLLPFLTPVITEKELIAGTYMDIAGNINNSSEALVIGEGFNGQIDEIRLWNEDRSAEDIDYDYARVLASDESGLAAYWRCDENFGSSVYDASKSNGEFHRNDGIFSGSVSWSNEIPNKVQLGWMGKTDENGAYIIPYIPYLGSGENFTLTPRYEQHQFDPSSRTVFIGEGASVLNGQDFTDVSSFEVNGSVSYENTTCGVEGAILYVDGEAVMKNGSVVYSDANGEFEIDVPVGDHYVSVAKSGHIFDSYKFPPGPESVTFDFQEPVSGLSFVDKTKVTVLGRVVGGTREGDKDPGLGLSSNNIGVANFTFESAKDCYSFDVKTDSLTGEFSAELPPMVFLIKDFDVSKNPVVAEYFSEFPEADFSVINAEQTVTHTYSGVVGGTVTIDAEKEMATIKIEGETAVNVSVSIINNGQTARFTYKNDVYQFPLNQSSSVTFINTEFEGSNRTDTAIYNYEYNLIYRRAPEIRVTSLDSVSEFAGETKVKYEDPVSKTLKEFNVAENPLYYPVFQQGEDYGLIVFAEEVYYNQDICDGINGCDETILDRVPVDDGTVTINNQLAVEENPGDLTLANGSVIYAFRGGEPNLLTDANYPWRDYTSVLTLVVNVDGVGYSWEPVDSKANLSFEYPLSNLHADDKYFRGYVLGANAIEGSDFVTNGPSVVDMILRDPPGSESYSYLEEGSSFSYEESLSTSFSLSQSMSRQVSLGAEFSTGIGYTVETEVTNDLSIGFTSTKSWNSDKTLTTEYTTTEAWQTDDSPELAGAGSDLFMGASKNFIVSLADNLTILPSDFVDAQGLPSAGEGAGGFKVCLNKSLVAAPSGDDTYFIYTADHIENYLIPNLIALRNNLFVNDPAYQSNISRSNALYGTNNDDVQWGNKATTTDPVNTDITKDYSGASYTFIPPDSLVLSSGEKVPSSTDMVREYNQQIRLWQEALERNEMEKYHAELIQNISYDAGPTFEKSVETTVTQSNTSSFEVGVNPEVMNELGAEVGGIGSGISMGLSFDYTTGKASTSTSVATNTFGYVLHDPDQGDYFSVDVMDAGTGTGPIFKIKGGRSMCPHETATTLNYYIPEEFLISQEHLNTLQSMEISDDLLKILSWDGKTGLTDFEDISSFGFSISDGVKNIIPSDADIQVYQIKDREFENKFDLVNAVEGMINMNLDFSLGGNENLLESVSDNLDGLSQSDIQDMSSQIETDGNSSFSKIYIFSSDKRDELLSEWARYRSYIYQIAGEPVKNAKNTTGISTVRREVPVLTTSTSLVENVPDDNTAYISLQLGNNSNSDETMWYELRVLEETNPNGAEILLDGAAVQRTFEIPAGEYINKTLTVTIGRPDVLEYDDIQVVLYSSCEWDYHTNGYSMPAEAIDTATFSVHFVPSCTDVEIIRPDNDFVINTEDEVFVNGVKETKVPILLSGYDLNNDIFEKLNFQFKSEADPDWIAMEDLFVVAEEDQLEIPGNYTALEWDLSGYPDGEYNLRAKTYCGYNPEGNEIFDLSEVWNGVVDRQAPQVFGTPQPADGILSPDDDVIIEFNEDIYGAKLSELANFDIRGVLNGTDLRHDVSLGFRNNTEDFVRIPDGINLVNKSFTIEFWMQTLRSGKDECIFSQGTDPDNSVYIELTSSGKFKFHIGDKTYYEDGVSTAGIINEWHHWAFIYDRIRTEVIVMMDGEPVGTAGLNPSYTGYGDVYLGKSMIDNSKTFSGNIHELRIWERPRTASSITANMLITLSGKETGLIGYWPFDEAYGSLGAEKVHRRNATVSTEWHITPTGYAATLNGSTGLLNMDFSDVAFSSEQDFSIEFWFKSDEGSNTCLLSNGYGDENDVVLYYYSLENLASTANVLPLEDGVENLLKPLVGKIYHNESDFLGAIANHMGMAKVEQYKEQLLRFGKHLPTYWSINTDAGGNFRINNNGKRIKFEDEANYFDNQWHHFALVVQRVGNTRIYLDGELKSSEPSTEWNGFGAARLFLGARGLFNPNISGFQFDQFFNGSLDEVRIWSSALKKTQIQRNSNTRLDGDELGLVSYFPFESYEEVMEVPLITGTKQDFITNSRAVSTNLGVTIQASDVPNVQMIRPSSKVDFSFVAQDNRVAFVLNEPNEKIENCILDITVKDIEDMHGNKMGSPVTWSAFVDRNQMKWGDDKFDLEKEIYEPLTFTTEIINSSGKQQAFSIENLPDWCTVSPQEGTLDPLTSREITFTVSEGVNVGTYSKDISLVTDFGYDEKLQVNLQVYKPLPADWKITPQNYEHSMNVIGVVSVNKVISADPYDRVAAFVGDECRGMATLKYIEDYDLYEVYLDVYSNKVYGEYFELHIWDASSGQEFRAITADGLKEAPEEYPKHYEFIDNNIYGSPSEPIKLEANNTIIQKIEMAKGWNWLSCNLALDRSKTLSQTLDNYSFINGDMIKGLTSYTEYYDSWIGTLNFLEPEQMYMFQVGVADTLQITGVSLDAESTPIPILRGWNWIGYTPSVNVSINDALGKFTPNHGDVIKSQFSFSMYDTYMGWVGTLEYLRPNQGYKYKYLESTVTPDEQQLFYPKAGTMLKSAPENKDEDNPVPNWADYQYTMSLVAVVEGPKKQNNEDQIRVYFENELRGVASPLEVSDDKLMYFITIYSNRYEEELNFEYITADGIGVELSETLLFKDDVEGSTDFPFVFYVSNDLVSSSNNNLVGEAVYNVYPNPVKNKVTINIGQPVACDVEISILNMEGKRLMVLPVLRGLDIVKTVDLQSFASGVYMMEIKSQNNVIYKKIVKE
ncbi:LamG-like jellyroll fold domain-containing protein [Maribellus maritimus]|uniref:LamG-like jellyroll fold domain-containing protein n=1 Tax=Maribellus maritimus TaxID=2870838 RepID=UPI001EEB4CF2|nr:LamG-like jellyroll fold domain-containing protein [Maribellus maritimus]MCG6191088.1 T9SS type A sorting domain-containing protein [Maribellus maritimus]